MVASDWKSLTSSQDSGVRGAAPFRAELLGPERLTERAREIALAQKWSSEPLRGTPLLPLLDTAARQLADFNSRLAIHARTRRAVSPAVEWLLDNYYLVEEQIRAVREDLPADYGVELPHLVAGEYAGFPRVYQPLVALVAHTDARLDEDYLLHFVDGLQDISPLTIGECWAVPIMLRIALIENVRRIASRVVTSQENEYAADDWANRLVAAVQESPDEIPHLVAQLDRERKDPDPAFLMQFSQRLQGQEAGIERVNEWIAGQLSASGIDLESVVYSQQHEQATDQISIANAITSVRFLDAFDWNAFFERASFVEQILRQDPVDIYGRMDFKSRDRYRHALEAIAKRCPHGEVGVAEAAVSWSLQALDEDPSDLVRGHVGFYLISGGRYQFESSIDYQPHGRELVYRGPLRYRGAIYWGLLAGVTTVLAAILGAYATWTGLGSWGIAALMALAVVPFSDLALSITNRVSAWLFPPRVLPKLDYRKPVATSHRTLVVVPALLSSSAAAQRIVDNLERAFLANADPNIHFAILGDLRGGASEHADGDSDVTDAATEGIRKLNARYGDEFGFRPFHLFVRARRWSETEGLWMGWERKRGALTELSRLLRGAHDTTFSTEVGERSYLRDVTFVITLDADTILPRDGGRKLVSTIAHPLNRAHLNPESRMVTRGYGLVQPRVGMSLPAAARSRLASLYSGITGIDPYSGAVSDTYQDVFGEGSFTGKGIYEVGVFNAVLEGRIPDGVLLSHDLLEGCFLRTALVSDVEVLDDYPATYASQAARVHRWVRGDWQTLPWLFPSAPDASGRLKPNPLGLLHRWKILDNLRRSAVAPSMMLLIAAGWLLLPGPDWAWPVLVLGVLFFPAYFNLADSMLFRPEAVNFRSALHSAWRDFGRDSARGVIELALLPHQAHLMLDAGIRALYRAHVSKRKTLEWETAADAERRLGNEARDYIGRMWPSVAGALLLTAPGVLVSPAHLVMSVPLWILWIASPLLAWWISTPLVLERRALTEDEVRLARRLARKTWRFFETFVTAEDHWLAPDNFQEAPKGEVARRTSPTNLGLQLLSYLTAYDLGYLPLPELVEHTSRTMASMAGLERFRGHFYNWYDTATVQPLRPGYISTVDSGNLAGHLLVLRIGLLEASESPLVTPRSLEGLVDTIGLALEDLHDMRDHVSPREAVGEIRVALEEMLRRVTIEEPPGHLGGWLSLARGLVDATENIAERGNSLTAAGDAWEVGRERLVASLSGPHRETRALLQALTEYAPWASLLGDVPLALRECDLGEVICPLTEYVPSLVGLAEGLEEALDALGRAAANPPGDTPSERESCARWARGLADGILAARPACVHLLARARLQADIAREMWEHTDFRMLYDRSRGLFSIGFNTAEGRLDSSFYDMLASECRLASFLAVAKGDVPQEHWFRLGRAIAQTDGGRALVSWSASMFEYLMPLLVMKTWANTLLDDTYQAVVRRQVLYGKQRGVPWGVSESAFNAKDVELTYQYQAFGVPGLGLKRGLSDDVVIAPYATVLAIAVDPEQAMNNLGALIARGAEGRYGLYEAIDYTPGRVPAGEQRAVVRAYFAHHQGMSLVALGNELTDYRMQWRFHADPMVQSAELLLQERVPRHIQLTRPHVEEVMLARSVRELPAPLERSYPLPDTPVPATHFLSNGRYSVMVTNAGGGYSRWEGLAVTRYREDITRDCWGTFVYLKDIDTGDTWSVAHQPSLAPADVYGVTFSADKAEFRRVDGTIETHMEVVVSPEDDVEVRRISITNHGRGHRRVELTSYMEVALTPQASDQAHKAFSNLFVETEHLPDVGALLFTRRPRSSEEARVWGMHVLACEASVECGGAFETDRAAFIGRMRSIHDPRALDSVVALSGSSGAVLDPICALRQVLSIPSGETAHVAYSTGVARSKDAAIRLAEKYRDIRTGQRAATLAWTASQVEIRNLGITAEEAVSFQRLASRLLLTDPCSPLKIKTPIENGLPLSGLWSLGISGDLPILLIRIERLEETPLVRQALLAHQYWRHKGLVADLVILNTRPSAYVEELDQRLNLLVRTGHALQLVDKPGGIFLRRADQMHPDVLNLLVSVARATLDGDAGPLVLQLNRRGDRPQPPSPFVASASPRRHPAPPFERPALAYDNGYGGFDAAAEEYVVVLEDSAATPAPWVNVMASPEFGSMVSEAGVGCTWALNSHENRITTWNNDPVTDGSGEIFYVRDEETGEYWSPTPLPVRGDGPYVIRHGKGYTNFTHTSHGVEHSLDWFAAHTDPVRVVRVRLRNISDRPRRLSVTHLVEWSLGSSRSKAQQLVVTWFDAENDILTAHNHFNMDFPGRSAFLACDRPLHSYTGSRTEFLGRNGDPHRPAAMLRAGLGGTTGRFHDNCGALMTVLEIPPGSTEEVSFFLGQTPLLEQARELVARYREEGAVAAELSRVRDAWRRICGAVSVETPDASLDLLLNGFLLYQVLSCRVWGRTATYQSSGALGFRDQLQDVMALLLARPDVARDHIVEASRRQFPEGDVLHWWHPYSGRGVRTRFSDDRQWLPYAVTEYISATGDLSVLDEMTPFLEGPPVDPGREDSYLAPAVSSQAVTVYEHCVAALEAGRPTGAHGLPLIGSGDWNDGMNRVGHQGRGESVWLAWFLDYVLRRFADLCEERDDIDRATDYRAWAKSLVKAIEDNAWDGAWYRRAYFDDGTPLGSRDSEECRIDAIAQAWAMIAGSGDKSRAMRALESVEEKLVRWEDGLIALLTPPFDRMAHDPGYIKGYVPGVRENGGQYTHAAAWVVLAYLLMGDGDEALALFDLINPVNHTDSRAAADTYRVEPYVVAADVYAVSPHTGRGGWTWYTGSASWLYRVAVGHLLGLRTVAEGQERYLVVEPCIPKSWPSYRMAYRYGETTYRIEVANPRGVNRGVERVEVDGAAVTGARVLLVDDGRDRDVKVVLLGG